MNSGIYILTFNGEEDKVYIGKSIDISSRFRDHCNKLKIGRHVNYKLQKAYLLHGVPLLSIIEYIDSSEEEYMYSKEISWITEFNSVIEGFNLTSGGDTGPIFKGDKHPNCTSSKIQLVEVFNLLCDTYLTQKEISRLSKVPIGVVERIAQGVNHRWLEEEFPEKYKKLLSIDREYKRSSSKNTGEDKGIKYPVLISPQGTTYNDIPNLSLFARAHGLQTSNLHKLFKKERLFHKGWKLG